MLIPEALKRGDIVAIVSLSSGLLGEKEYIHKYEIAKERLEQEFGLQVKAMPHALKGLNFVYQHPELRAKDLMDAFQDTTIKAIVCAIGGDDTIRLLPYIDYQIIQQNPKIFMGYSDSTANHLMLYKAGLVSFYGPTIMVEFGEYGSMFAYTTKAVKEMLFQVQDNYEITSSPYWSKDFVPWSLDNVNTTKQLLEDTKGYEVLQGTGKVKGELLGGCLDAMVMYIGTTIWPTLDQWVGKILFLETSEEKPTPNQVTFILRNFAAQGILQVVSGIIVGKPQQEVYYEEYKEVYKQVLKEVQRPKLPIFYNVNFGHASPIGILPYGIETELDCDRKTITLLQSPVK